MVILYFITHISVYIYNSNLAGYSIFYLTHIFLVIPFLPKRASEQVNVNRVGVRVYV